MFYGQILLGETLPTMNLKKRQTRYSQKCINITIQTHFVRAPTLGRSTLKKNKKDHNGKTNDHLSAF